MLVLFVSLITLTYQLEPPEAELALIAKYRVATSGIGGIIPLDSNYLCFGTMKGELKIFDRQTGKIISDEDSLKEKVAFLALTRHNNYIYGLTGLGKIYCFLLDVSDHKKPILGKAQMVNLDGEHAEELLSTDSVVVFKTRSNKIIRLKGGVAEMNKSIDVNKIAVDLVRENQATSKKMLFRLITAGNSNHLLVATTHRLRVFDLETLQSNGDYRYDTMYTCPDDIILADGKYLVLFWGGRLTVIDRTGKHDNYKIPDGYLRIVYCKQSNVYVICTANHIEIMTPIGTLGKPYIPPTCIGNLTGLQRIYVSNDKVYLGIDAYDRQDQYVGGGDLLEFEIIPKRK